MTQKTQYFKLAPELLLRGWRDMKYGFVNWKEGGIVGLTRPVADALELAWNGISIDSPVMLPSYRKALEELVRYRCGTLTEQFSAPLPEQLMKSAPCNYTAAIHWSITGRCNMKCRHCYVDAPDALYGELPLADCVAIMDQMLEANIYTISLTGGEPLVRPDWWEFYQELKKRRISVESIYTNGLLVTDKWLERFEKYEDRKLLFSLSFDGIGHHDWLRGRDGMERITIDTIQRLVKRGYPVEIETALYKDNAPAMPDTCALLAELGVRNWKISEISKSNAWEQYAQEHTASQKEVNNCYLQILDRFSQLGRPFALQLDHRYLYSTRTGKATALANHGDAEGKSLKQPICSCMRLHPYLLPNGTLMPCMPLSNCGLDHEMPNLLKTPLCEILSDESKFFDFISITPEEMFAKNNSQCGTCEYRTICCGGCRAKAHACGNLYGPDAAMCEYFRGEIRKLFEPYYDQE